jgi:hypothetical protein
MGIDRTMLARSAQPFLIDSDGSRNTDYTAQATVSTKEFDLLAVLTSLNHGPAFSEHSWSKSVKEPFGSAKNAS